MIGTVNPTRICKSQEDDWMRPPNSLWLAAPKAIAREQSLIERCLTLQILSLYALTSLHLAAGRLRGNT
jgi:hypothetical protein